MESIKRFLQPPFSGIPSSQQYHSTAKSAYPSYLFHHKELIHDFSKGKKVYKKRLTNAINYLHFVDKPILVHLQHLRFKETLLVKAFPEPCLGDEIICLWLDEYKKGLELEKCRLIRDLSRRRLPCLRLGLGTSARLQCTNMLTRDFVA